MTIREVVKLTGLSLVIIQVFLVNIRMISI